MTSKTRTIPIFFNQAKYDVELTEMSGIDLKSLFGVAAADRLFRKGPGDDEEVGDGQQITLKPGDHFYALPTDVTGG